MGENILQRLRNSAGMTQQSVADQLLVSVNTIQNWERSGNIAKESLHALLNLYGVSAATRNEAVLEIFGNASNNMEEKKEDHFPTFLFTDFPEVIKAAYALNFSVEEMEVFGYMYYMLTNKSGGYDTIDFPYDYAFFKDHGGYYRTQNMIQAIRAKLGPLEIMFKSGYSTEKYNKLYNLLNDFGIRNPNMPFSFVASPKATIMEYVNYFPGGNSCCIDVERLIECCKTVETGPLFIGTDSAKAKDLPENIKKIISENDHSYYSRNREICYHINLSKVGKQCLAIQKKEYENEEYLTRKSVYLRDKAAYDEHPNLYDKAPVFVESYDYYLVLTDIGRKLIEWWQ